MPVPPDHGLGTDSARCAVCWRSKQSPQSTLAHAISKRSIPRHRFVEKAPGSFTRPGRPARNRARSFRIDGPVAAVYRIHLALSSFASLGCAVAWVEYRSAVWIILLGLCLSWLATVVILRDLRDLRGRLWEREGKCPGCGYDLRESRDRCPECGRVHSRRP